MTRKTGKCCDCGIPTSRNDCLRCGKCAGIYKRKNKDIDVKTYRRYWHIQQKYKMSKDEFDGYWQACRGKCWICNKAMEWPTQSRGQGLDIVTIDHNHSTGEIRGLLCGGCNKGLGFFKDSVKLLNSAVKYMEGL